MTIKPEIKLARRLVEKYKLSPPVPILDLIEKYADLEIINMPFEIDGVSIGLKIPGRKPKVILNSARRSSTRRRFTLAHELGHIVIPWHTGLIIDKLDPGAKFSNPEYWALEAEANRFASELLMPQDWVMKNLEDLKSNPVKTVRYVSIAAEVSIPAAIIKVNASLPDGFTYACVEGNTVIRTESSKGTYAPAAKFDTNIEIYEFADRATRHYKLSHGDLVHHWWKFEVQTGDASSWPDGDWRAELTKLVGELKLDSVAQKNFLASLNGVVASINSSMKENRSPYAMLDAFRYRIKARADTDRSYAKFIKHERFEVYLKLRIKAFLGI